MKKGSFIITTEMLLWAIPRFLILIVVVFAIFVIVGAYVEREVDLIDLEAETIVTRLLYSSNCLVYSDGIRQYPGIIDINKFTNERLEQCLDRVDFSARLILNDINENEISRVFINIEQFDDTEPFCAFEEYNCAEERKYVLVYNNGNLVSGFLDILLVIKNE